MVEIATVLDLRSFKKAVEQQLSLESPIAESTFHRYRNYIQVQPPYLASHVRPLAMFIGFIRLGGCNYQQAEAAVKQQLQKEKKQR